MVTEEQPDRNGPTEGVVREALPPGTPVFTKPVFGLADVPEIAEAVETTGRHTAVLIGAETDVCVAHSALGLLDRGFRVAVVADATYSPESMHDHGLRRIAEAGGVIVHAKGVYYEWLRTVEAATAFRNAHPDPRGTTRVQPLVRRCGALSDGGAADVPPHGRDPGPIEDGLEPADRAEARPGVAVVVGRVRRLEIGRDAKVVPAREVGREQGLADASAAMVGVRREKAQVVVRAERSTTGLESVVQGVHRPHRVGVQVVLEECVERVDAGRWQLVAARWHPDGDGLAAVGHERRPLVDSGGDEPAPVGLEMVGAPVRSSKGRLPDGVGRERQRDAARDGVHVDRSSLSERPREPPAERPEYGGPSGGQRRGVADARVARMLDHEEKFLFKEEILHLSNAVGEPGVLDNVEDLLTDVITSPRFDSEVFTLERSLQVMLGPRAGTTLVGLLTVAPEVFDEVAEVRIPSEVHERLVAWRARFGLAIDNALNFLNNPDGIQGHNFATQVAHVEERRVLQGRLTLVRYNNEPQFFVADASVFLGLVTDILERLGPYLESDAVDAETIARLRDALGLVERKTGAHGVRPCEVAGRVERTLGSKAG